MIYLEPPSVVQYNNNLMAARGEAMAAEEAILWQLTGTMMGLLPELQQMFEASAWRCSDTKGH